MRRTIEVMLVGAIVLDVAYWSIWFTSRDTSASEHRTAYYEFENAFPLADAWLGLACLLALVALRQRRPRRTSGWSARARPGSTCSAWTSCTTSSTASSPLAGAASIEAGIVAVTLVFSLTALRFAWTRRDALLAGRSDLGFSVVALTIGIVGLPNAGKSTLFNALTKNDVLAANYPFATIEPNVGVVGVPDERLRQARRDLRLGQACCPATVEFVDIAGIVQGRLGGGGAGQQVPLAHPGVGRDLPGHPGLPRRGRHPRRRRGEPRQSDISTIQTEMILADLQTVEKAIPRLEKEARGDKARAANLAAAQEAKDALEAGTPIIATKIDRALVRELSLLTAKPYIYVFNCDADELADEALKEKMRELVAPAEAIFLDAKFEAELVELGDDDEAREMLAEMGVDEPGLDVLARVGFDTLGLQTYLTAGPKESRAWTIRKGATAPEAAGVIHTDFQKGFIKAEIVSFDDLVAAGSMNAAKAAGKVRMEGKDYVMADGDVVEFRFNVYVQEVAATEQRHVRRYRNVLIHEPFRVGRRVESHDSGGIS